IGDTEAIAHQISSRLRDPRGHRFDILYEVVPRRLNGLWRCAIDMLEAEMATQDVERSRVELRRDKVAPLVQYGATLGIARRHQIRMGKSLTQVLNDRRALGQ